jgi:CBS domain containing-hemolysin-like protein
VGGLVFSQLGRIPVEGDVVDVDGYRLEVQSVSGRRVGKVRISVRDADAQDEADADADAEVATAE